jgi:hypothetical protein
MNNHSFKNISNDVPAGFYVRVRGFISRFFALFTFATIVAGNSCTCLAVAALMDDPMDREALKLKDRLSMKSGAVFIGKVLGEKVDDGRTMISFKTQDGLFLQFDKARMISKIYQLTEEDIAYNEKIEAMKDTAEEHHDLYEWCVDQKAGRSRYKDQIKFHLERIMELDPNDDKVRRKLGYTFLKNQGRWVPEDLYNEKNGYERAAGSWRPTLQSQLEDNKVNNRETNGNYRVSFDVWRRKLRKSNANIPALFQELRQLCTPNTITLIFQEAREEPNERLRAEYIEAFGEVKSYAAMEALVYFAIEDPNSTLRDRALTLLQHEEHYPPQEAATRLTGYFSDKRNTIIQRAAYAVGEIGSEVSILPLIDVLVTRHQLTPKEDPGRMKAGFGNNGIQSFQMGADPTKSGPTDIKNQSVADALKKITGESLGDQTYNKDAWRRWYVKYHTLTGMNLRDE